MAASAGGPSALATILAGLGGLAAPVLVVQHLHPDFTRGLFDWLAGESSLPVEMAQHDQSVLPGHVYLAPGALHLRLAANRRMELSAAPATIHRPSADQLFLSVAEHAGSAAVGVLLSGMGDDGARGLLEIHRRRGHTFGQDEASCAVFGMPQAAQRLGAVTDLLPPDRVASAIHRAVAAIRL
jgi:two-component system, chemotaxis family, protein-glutamate methylesterase/glutaminase